MKKIGLCLAVLLVMVGMTSFTGYAAEPKDTATAVYLVPGSYYEAGNKVLNTVTSGAEKLSEEQAAALFTENVYCATGAAGEKLPIPATTNDNVTFNGWWYTEHAEVTYTETVPKTTAPVFLYADWRAALSQPMNPVNPEEGIEKKLENYMEITHVDGSVEQIEIFVSVPDAANVFKRKQFYNEYFVLYPGDTFEFFLSGIYLGDGPQRVPQPVMGNYMVQLESTAYTTTRNYIRTLDKATGEEIGGKMKEGQIPFWKCIAPEARVYRMFNKFYDAGGSYFIYMEWLKQYTVV